MGVIDEKVDNVRPKQKLNIAPKGLGYRHLQALMLFFTLSMSYAIRAHLGVTMVAMTAGRAEKEACKFYPNSILEENLYLAGEAQSNLTNVEDTDELFRNRTCERYANNFSKWNVMRTYNWNIEIQDAIMFAFFVGETALMIPMGIVVQKIGGKPPLLFALGANGVLSILTPWVTLFCGWIGVCIIRVINGMTQSCLFPSIHTILAKWAPLSERGRLSAFIYTGTQCGTVLVFQLAGFLSSNPSFGWPSVFWAVGALNLTVFVLVWWLGASTPHEHKKISVEELKFITGELSGSKPRARKIPWKHILTSKPIWGLIVAQTASTMAYIMIYVETPMYMSQVLDVNIKKVGVYSSLPYISLYVMIIGVGYLTDFLVNRKVMRLVNIRRMNNTIGMALSGLFMIAFAFVNNTLAAVIMQVLCLGLHAGVYHGFHVNQIDLAPNFAGSIMALSNMISNLFSLLVPVIVVSVLHDDLRNQSRWQIAFLILGCLEILANLVFLIFVKASIQDWNNIGDDDDNVTSTNTNIQMRPLTEDIHEENEIGTI